MLPSKELRTLGQQVILVAVRLMDPRAAELRKEFSVPYLNSWVIVLDRKGETLDSWMGDDAGHACDGESAAKFPRRMVQLIRMSLRNSESVQQLERRWRKDRAAFDTLADRLQEMHAYSKLRQLCTTAGEDASLPKEQREECELRAFLARANDPTEDLKTRKGRSRFVRDAEELLVRLAHHPTAAELPGALFARACAHEFDVPARANSAIRRLEKLVKKLENPGPLTERIAQFVAIRREWIEHNEKCLETVENDSVRRHIAALLGDCQAAIDLDADSACGKDPRYQRWAREVRRKLQRQSKALFAKMRP